MPRQTAGTQQSNTVPPSPTATALAILPVTARPWSALQAGETVAVEDGGRGWRGFDKVQERPSFRTRTLDRRERIDDGLVGAFGEALQDLDLAADLRVRGVNDAERAFTAFHEGQRRAHVIRTDDPTLEWHPPTQIFEALLGIDAHRHHAGFTGAQLAAEGAGDVEVASHPDRNRLALRRNQNQFVAE